LKSTTSKAKCQLVSDSLIVDRGGKDGFRIYDYLVEHTDWDLTLDSDDADDIIASRIKSHTK
jgi:hypothetical protein